MYWNQYKARHSNKDPVELSPVVDKSGSLLGLRSDPEFRKKDKEFRAKYDNAFDLIEKVRDRVEFISTMEELVAHLRLELAAASGDPRKVQPAEKLIDASREFASDVLGITDRRYHQLDQATMLYCNIVFLTTEFHVSQVIYDKTHSSSHSLSHSTKQVVSSKSWL